MAMHEEQGEKRPLMHDRSSGGMPLPLPRTSTAIQGGIFTVVYFMPDGDAIIRYQQRIDENSFLMRAAFYAIRVIPSVNGAAPALEIIKPKPEAVVLPPQKEGDE